MKPPTATTTITVGVSTTLILLAATGVLRVKKRVDKAKAILGRFGPLDQLTPEKIGSVGAVLIIEKLLHGLTGDEEPTKNEFMTRVMDRFAKDLEQKAHRAGRVELIPDSDSEHEKNKNDMEHTAACFDFI